MDTSSLLDCQQSSINGRDADECLCTLITQISPTFFYEKDNIHNTNFLKDFRRQPMTMSTPSQGMLLRLIQPEAVSNTITRKDTQTDTVRCCVRRKALQRSKGVENVVSTISTYKMFKYGKTVWSLFSHDMGRLHHSLPVTAGTGARNFNYTQKHVSLKSACMRLHM